MKPQLRLIATAASEVIRRQEMVERMAEVLVKHDAAENEQDAIRCLMARGFSPLDVMVRVADARQVAFQRIVAAEMGKS